MKNLWNWLCKEPSNRSGCRSLLLAVIPFTLISILLNFSPNPPQHAVSTALFSGGILALLLGEALPRWLCVFSVLLRITSVILVFVGIEML